MYLLPFLFIVDGGAVEGEESFGLPIYWTYGVVCCFALYCIDIVGIQTDDGVSRERGEGVPGACATSCFP